MRKILFTVLLLAATTAGATCNESANKARMENRIDDAINILNECLDEELSRLARTYLLLGLSHYEKRTPEARDCRIHQSN